MGKKLKQALPGVVQCQRCLEYGHWSYECKNQRTYVFRPSASMQFRNPDLKPDVSAEKPPKIPKVTDGDKKRGVPEDSSSSEEDIQLPIKRAKESSSSSSDSSGSSDSGSSSGSGSESGSDLGSSGSSNSSESDKE